MTDDPAAALRRQAARVRWLSAAATAFGAAGRHQLAVATASVTAQYAWHRHPGTFRLPRLERVIARAAPPGSAPAPGSGMPERVLHVLTEAYDVGGHSILAARWIARDTDRRHAVHLTAQPPRIRPAWLPAGVDVADPAAPLGERVRRLRAAAADADLVVLHAHPHDPLPLLALAGCATPALHVNHADHTAWLAARAPTVHIRDSGAALAAERRGLPGPVLPVPLDPPREPPGRADARAALGLDPGAVVALTVGNPYKYGGGGPFLDLLAPVLAAHPSLVLLAAGPAPEGAWAGTGARVRALGYRTDLPLLHAAADLYLEAWPFPSLMALLEAAAAGLPCVSRVRAGDAGTVFASDAPGLTAHHEALTTDDEWRAVVGRLVDHPGERARLAGALAADVRAAHVEGWTARLDAVYADAVNAAQGPAPLPPRSRPGPLDERLAVLHHGDAAFPGLAGIVERQARQWSPRVVRVLRALARADR